MAAKLIRLTHEIAIQLHLVVDSCTIRSSRFKWPVRKLLDTSSYFIAVPLCVTATWRTHAHFKLHLFRDCWWFYE